MNMHYIKSFAVRIWVCFFLTLPLLAFADATTPETNSPLERVVWSKTPIEVSLAVGEERLVHFPTSVSVGLSPSLKPLLRSQSINGTLYLTARQPFDTTRVMVRSEREGPMYVLDVTAVEHKPEDPMAPDMQVLLPNAKESNSGQGEAANIAMPSKWGYVALTRFVAQQLYAPARLVPNGAGIVPVPVRRSSVALVRGDRVEAVPVASWRAGRLMVTAVELVNSSHEAVILDPRELRGHWLAATFQHNRLLPAGDEADTTTLYLISDRAFETAL